MKKLMTILMAAALILGTAGCSSVSEEDYQSALDAKTSLESRLDENKKELDTEKSSKDELVSQNETLTSEKEALESRVAELEAKISEADSVETAGDVEAETEIPETPAELAVMFQEEFGSSSDDGELSVEYDEATDTMSFLVTQEGGAEAVKLAIEGDEESLEGWEAAKLMYLDEIYETMAMAIEAAGFPETNVVVSIMNDESPDEVLLSVENGEIVVDAVEDAE